MCSHQRESREKKVLYDVFDEDYLIVCTDCYTQYHAGIRPSATFDVVDRARKAMQTARECEVCGHQFTSDVEGGSR